MKAAWRAAFLGVGCCGLVAVIGCAPLEPIVEPEVSDLQLTVDTLKTTIRDAQRTIVDLRAELDARRQELADAQIARAQLEGRVREAERRLAEARQVIDLQREELAGARSERERVTRSSAALHNQLKQLQQQLSKMGKQANETQGAGVAPAGLPPQRRHTGSPAAKADQVGRRVAPAIHLPNGPTSVMPDPETPSRVSVKPGDTLWSIAQRYRVPVKRLMAMNRLSDTHIEIGQALWLSERPGTDGQDEGTAR